MANTPRGYPYPASTDSPAGMTQIQSLATAIDTDVGTIATTQSGLVLRRPKFYPRPAANAAPGSPGLGGNSTWTVASVAIPDPGYEYYVEAGATLHAAIFNGSTTTMTGIYLQINLDEASFSPSPTTRIIVRGHVGAEPAPQWLTCPRSFYRSSLTGSHTIYLILRNESSPSNFLTYADDGYYTFNVVVHPTT